MSFLLLTGLFSIDGFAQEDGLYIVFQFTAEDGNRKDAQVIVKKNGETEKKIPGAKKMEYLLELNTNYVLEFQLDGYITKKIAFNTKIPGERKDYPFEPFFFRMTIFPQMDEVNTVIFNQPVAKVAFSDEMDDFDYDVDYTKSIHAAMAEVEAEIAAVKEQKAADVSSGKRKDEEAIKNANSNAGSMMTNIGSDVTAAQNLIKALPKNAENDELYQLIDEIKAAAEDAKKTKADLAKENNKGKALALADDIKDKQTGVAEKLKKAQALKNKIEADKKKQEELNLSGRAIVNNEIIRARKSIEDAEKELARLKDLVEQNDGIAGKTLKAAIAISEQDLRKLRNLLAQLDENMDPDEAKNKANNIVDGANKTKDDLRNAENAFNGDAADAANKGAVDDAIKRARKALDAADLGIGKIDDWKDKVAKLPATPSKEDFDNASLKGKGADGDARDLFDKLNSGLPKAEALKLAQQVIEKAEEALAQKDKAKAAFDKMMGEVDGRQKALDAIQAAKDAAENANKKKAEALALINQAAGVDQDKLRGLIDALNNKGQDMNEKANKLDGDMTDPEYLNLSHSVVIAAEDIVRASKKLIDALAALKQAEKDADAINLSRQITVKNYDDAVKQLAEAVQLEEDLEDLGANDDYVDILLEKAQAYKDDSERALEKMNDPTIRKDEAIGLSQYVLIKANDMNDLSKEAKRNLEQEIRSIIERRKVQEIMNLALQAVIRAEETAASAKMVGDELGHLSLAQKVILNDAIKHAKFQALKARHEYQEMSEGMPLYAAEELYEKILVEKEKVLANATVCEDERTRLANTNFSAAEEASNRQKGIHHSKTEDKISFDDKKVEEFKDARHTTTTVTITKDADEIIYKKVRHNWGGIFYFKDNVSITALTYQQETLEN